MAMLKSQYNRTTVSDVLAGAAARSVEVMPTTVSIGGENGPAYVDDETRETETTTGGRRRLVNVEIFLAERHWSTAPKEGGRITVEGHRLRIAQVVRVKGGWNIVATQGSAA